MEPAIAAERVGHRDQATLIVDPPDRLFCAQVARDRFLQEQTDDLPVAAADFLADDDAEAVGELAQTQRALDRVVVGGAHDVQTGRLDGGGLRAERRSAIGRVFAVRVHVDLDLAHAIPRVLRPRACASSTTLRMRSRNRDTSKRRAERHNSSTSHARCSTRSTASANASGSAVATSAPSIPSRTISGAPPAASATTGAPDASASTHTIPKSSSAGKMKPRADPRSCFRVGSSTRPAKVTLSRASCSSDLRSRPSPTTMRRRPTSLNARTATSTRLYAESRDTMTQKSPRSSAAANASTSTGGWITSLARP